MNEIKKIIGLTLLRTSLLSLTGCNALSMSMKNLQSNYGNLPRTISVYDINGKLIKEYSGNVYISDASADGWEILKDGKKINILCKTGTIIAEEEAKE